MTSSGQVEVRELPEAPVTGDATVDQAVEFLSRAALQSLDQQVAAFDTVHRTLHARLDDVEQ